MGIFGWFRRKPVAAAVAGDGVLFGLDPPEGCQFDVHFSDTAFWHVKLLRGGEMIEWACSHVSSSDEDAITRAAKQVLERHHRGLGVQSLVGLYPPKRTGAP